MTTPATVLLDAAGIAYRLLEYEAPADAFGPAVVSALGLDPDTTGKTLVVSGDEGTLVAALVSVSARVDLKALARCCGVRRMVMADADDVQRRTGYVLGGVAPLGSRTPLPLYVDTLLAAADEIHVSGGRRGLEVAVAPGDLVTLTDATVADIAVWG